MLPFYRTNASIVRMRSRFDFCFHGFSRRNHPVNDTKILRFFGSHEVIAIQCVINGLVILTRMRDVNFVQPALDLDDILSMALNIRSLALKTT